MGEICRNPTFYCLYLFGNIWVDFRRGKKEGSNRISPTKSYMWDMWGFFGATKCMILVKIFGADQCLSLRVVFFLGGKWRGVNLPMFPYNQSSWGTPLIVSCCMWGLVHCLRTSCSWIPDPLRWHSVIWHCHPHCLVQIKHSSRRVNSTLAGEFKEHF